MKTRSLEVERVGQIQKADVTLGDLTVFVGPQATGKSIFFFSFSSSLRIRGTNTINCGNMASTGKAKSSGF